MVKRKRMGSSRTQNARPRQFRRTFVPNSIPRRSVKGTNECNFVDNGSSLATPNIGPLTIINTAQILPMNLIVAGNSMFNRLGRKCRLRSFEFRGFYDIGTATTGTSQPTWHNLSLIWDKQPNGAVPAIGDIYADVDQAGALTTNPQSGLNPNNRDRFELIRRVTKWIPQVTNTTGPLWSAMFPGDANEDVLGTIKFFVKLKERETLYKTDSSPAVIGDIASGSLLLVSFSDVAVQNVNMKWSARLRFYP